MSVHTRTRRIKGLTKKVKKSRVRTKIKEKSVPWREAFEDLFDQCTEAGVMLKGYRLKKEMTQRALGEAIGISQNHLSEMEHGKRPIGKELAKRFAKFFNTDYRIFL